MPDVFAMTCSQANCISTAANLPNINSRLLFPAKYFMSTSSPPTPPPPTTTTFTFYISLIAPGTAFQHQLVLFFLNKIFHALYFPSCSPSFNSSYYLASSSYSSSSSAGRRSFRVNEQLRCLSSAISMRFKLHLKTYLCYFDQLSSYHALLY